MIYKSALLTQASGSIGGLTASHNRGGMYFRSRAIPTNPNSVAQQAVRGAMQTLATAWGSVLTAVQRAAWATYAANVAMTNKLGDQVYYTGQQHYIRSNVPRLIGGLPRVDTGPTTFDIGSFTDPTMTASAATGDLTVAFTVADAWVGEDDSSMIIQQSREQAPSINFFKGPFRYVANIDGDLALPPTSPQVLTGLFALTLSNIVWARALVSRADGRLSSATIINTTIIA